MKKLLLISVFLFAINKYSYTSFPVNNVGNQVTHQSKDASEQSPIINVLGMLVLISLAFSYPFSIIWYLTKPIPKDIEQKKKFYKKLIFIIFTPLVLALLIYAYAYSTMFTF